MHEKRRFAIALAGVGACLCIAAGIVITGLLGIAIPAVHGVPAAHAQALPRLPTPSWSEVAASATPTGPGSRVREAPASHAQSSVRVAAPRAEAMTAAPAVLDRQSSIGNLQSPVPLMLSNAPQASGTDVVAAAHRTRDRRAVTGALITAGAHVGEGFRTMGRTLRRVF